MSFLKPMMLMGLLAALIPIIIHLIHKRRPRRQEFAAIEFVIRSVEKVQRRWRLRRFLLLAARVLIIAALALAAARPMLSSDAVDIVESTGPQRLVLVIDASLSMRGKTEDGQDGFSFARSKAKAIIESLGPEDQMTIVLAEPKPRLLLENLTNAKSQLLRVLTGVKPTYAYVDLADAISVAAQLFEGAKASKEEGSDSAGSEKTTENRIVILSDLAAHSLQQAAGLDPSVKLSIIDVFESLEDSQRVNYGITNLDVQVVPSTNANTVQARTRIRSFLAKKPAEVKSQATDINLVGPQGPVVQASVNIIQGNQTDKVLESSFEDSEKFGISVQLQDDFLVEDNVRFAQVDIQARVRSLVVDGAPSGLPKEDEIFYLERAMAAGSKDQPLPKIIIADDLAKEELGNYEVLILAGVTTISANDGQRITEFVNAGGGLLITASENMDIDQYNAVLSRVLPRAIRGLKRKEAFEKRSKDDDSALLAETDSDHPMMSLFTGEALQGLQTTRTQAYFLLQPNRNRKAEVIFTYDDGQPALIETRLGRGRSAFLTTSIDRDLTDLPIRPAFVPLVRQLLLYLGDALARPDERITLVGDQRALFAPEETQQVEVQTPSGERISVTDKFENGSYRFLNTDKPGHYEVFGRKAGQDFPIPSENFVVNVDPRESNVEPLLPSEAVAVLRGESNPSKGSKQNDEQFAFKVGKLSNPDELAHVLLMIMLLAFLAESLLTAQFKRNVSEEKSARLGWFKK